MLTFDAVSRRLEVAESKKLKEASVVTVPRIGGIIDGMITTSPFPPAVCGKVAPEDPPTPTPET